MRALLNINNYHYRRGGSEVVYFEHAALFAREGWDIAFFSMKHPRNHQTKYEKYFVNMIELGEYYSIFEKIGIASKIIYSREAVRNIESLLSEFPADVAHAHGIYHHLSPSVLSVLQRRGIPTVLTAHDFKLMCPAYQMFDGTGPCERCRPNAVHNCALHRCIHGSLAMSTLVSLESAIHRLTGIYRRNLARIVCPSRFMLDKFIEWGWDRDQLVHIPNPADLPSTPPQEPGRRVCYFGRLSSVKGLDLLIEAAAKSRVAVDIVGEGPERDQLEQRARALGAPVIFHGRRDGDALWSIVRAARACVVPSTWYENLPKSIQEAYGHGRIVIGAEIGGIPEMIVEGETGFLFPAGDSDALAERLSAVSALDDAVLRRMGDSARDLVRSRYSSDNYRNAMGALYGRLLDGQPERGRRR